MRIIMWLFETNIIDSGDTIRETIMALKIRAS